MDMFYFLNICRLCSGNKNVTLNLNNLDSDNIKLLNKLATIAPTLLHENDNLPLGICSVCYVKLNVAYKFVTQCLQVNNKLKLYKDKLLNKNINVNNTVVDVIQITDNDEMKLENVEGTEISNNIKKEIDIDEDCYETVEENKQVNNKIVIEENAVWFKKDVETIEVKIEEQEEPFSASESGEHFLASEQSEHFLAAEQREEIVATEVLAAERREEIVATEVLDSEPTSAENNQQEKLKTIKKPPHVDQRRFKCEKCGKVFRLKGDFKRHISTHSGERPFPCSTCGKSYTRQSDLKRHTASIHSDQKAYVCEICGKAFDYKCTLMKHLRVHSGERPYACDICGKAFAQYSNFKDHLLVHSDKKAFICDICGKEFSFKRRLRNHYQNIHLDKKSFRCEICNKCFATKSNLRNHLNAHTQVKPFECLTCGKGFIKKVNFTKHLLLHLNENSSPNA